MTDEKMALLELIEKRADADLVREMLHFAAGRVMELEIQACTGAAHGVRDPARVVQRHGYRERTWETRVGRIELAIPRLRRGSDFPSWSRGARRRRRRPRSFRRPTATVSPPGPSTTWSRRWAARASPRAR